MRGGSEDGHEEVVVRAIAQGKEKPACQQQAVSRRCRATSCRATRTAAQQRHDSDSGCKEPDLGWRAWAERKRTFMWLGMSSLSSLAAAQVKLLDPPRVADDPGRGSRRPWRLHERRGHRSGRTRPPSPSAPPPPLRPTREGRSTPPHQICAPPSPVSPGLGDPVTY